MKVFVLQNDAPSQKQDAIVLSIQTIYNYVIIRIIMI